MKQMLLYDPNRRPPDWVNAMQRGEFAALLTDVRTGEDVDAQGRAPSKDTPRTCLVFDNFAEARAYCQERAAAVENLRCEIFDHRGRAGPAVLEIMNPKFANRLGSRRVAGRKMMGAAALILSGVPLFFWDYYRGMSFLPTIVGVNMILVGLRLLHWGYSDLELLRAREKRLEEVEGK